MKLMRIILVLKGKIKETKNFINKLLYKKLRLQLRKKKIVRKMNLLMKKKKVKNKNKSKRKQRKRNYLKRVKHKLKKK